MTTTFKDFLIKAKINTYATNGEGKEQILENGSKKLAYEKDNLFYEDIYFGNINFVGEEIVYKNKKAIWGMNYFGRMVDNAQPTKEFGNFLKKSLSAIEKETPFRGPKKLIDKNFKYENKIITSDLNDFSGEEKIFLKNKLIFKLNYHGGKIIRR